jgi:DNA-binding transcriptional LysR family regulator
MREVNLRSVDLNLLTVLQALIEERHVTKAAEKLHMSQSAVSRALQRLRVLFNDPLLVKSAEGYTLSSRATKLATELSVVLQTLSRLVQEPEFIPSSSRATLRFAGIDLDAWIDMPKLIGSVLQEAPKLKMEVSNTQANYFEELSKGRADFVVSGFQSDHDQENIYSCRIGSSDLVAVMGKNNPLSEQTLTVEKYLMAKHGFVSITGKGASSVDAHLLALGLKRDVVLKVSDFKSVAEYCENTDIVFLLPRQLIKHSLIGRQVIIKSLPKGLYKSSIDFYIYWHARYDNDPLHRWIKQRMLDYVLN